MSLLRLIAALVAALAVQTALGRLSPEASRWVDVFLVPVVWYGMTRSQRWAMLVGCVAGLLQDAWFQVGAFGLNGFKKTLVGWLVGGVAARLDLNHPGARGLAGAAGALVDRLAEFLLRRLLDQHPLWPHPVELVVSAVVTGLLVIVVGGIVDRTQERHAVRRLA